MSCKGVTAADEEHMGDVEYYPTRGFDANFFPYTKGDKKFLTPLVAAKFLNPQRK